MLNGDVLFDATPHEAVADWDFLPDGSLKVSRAGILATTADDSPPTYHLGPSEMGPARGRRNRGHILDEQVPTVLDLFGHLRKHVPVNHVVFALALFKHNSRQTGMFLQTA